MVVSNFVPEAEAFVVHDPACAAPHKHMSISCLDRARQCFGTDEDVLIVSCARTAESIDSEASCVAGVSHAQGHYS